MKKIICIAVVMCILLIVSVVAIAQAIAISNNGVTVDLYPCPIIKNDRAFCTADAFYALNCSVIEIDYFDVAIVQKGNKKIFVQAGNTEYFVFEGTAKEFEEKVNMGITDDEKKHFSEAPFVENYIFYFPVRELCEEFGYTVSWENSTREVKLTSTEKVQGGQNGDIKFTGEIERYFKRLERIDKGEISDKKYEKDNFSLLYQYGICEKSDEEYITNREALRAFANLIGAEDSDADIEDWYAIDEFVHLDDKTNDSDKLLLLSILNWRGIITTEEVVVIDLDAPLKEGDAILFAVRSVGDTFGCTDYPVEMDYEEYSQAYIRAAEKGIIDEADVRNSEKAITRNQFYEILNRALFVEYSSGGYGGSSYRRRIDSFPKVKAPEKETVTKSEKIVVEALNNGNGYEWKMPECVTSDFSMTINAVTDKGEVLGYVGGGKREKIKMEEMLEIIARHADEKIRITYYDWNSDYTEKTEYYFDIDISEYEVIYRGEAPTPGVYYKSKGKWPLKKLTLADGEKFEEGKFYVICGKQKKYRKNEYNNTSCDVFMATETANELTYFGTTGTFGTSYLDEVRLVEICVEGKKIYITEKSETTFEVKEIQ